MSAQLKVTTPGRVCLFGEHQDYLGLPVIPCAISLRIALTGHRTEAKEFRIYLPDIGSSVSVPLAAPIAYEAERDYFRSVVNVMLRKGYTFSHGWECTVRGKIPINAGTSSSSALVVTWVNFLARISDQEKTLSPEEIARTAHEAEVLEFREPGGMMDHFSTAYGGVMWLRFQPELAVEKLTPPLKTFVLGDSMEPKDTKGILARVKTGVLEIVQRLRTRYPGFSLQTEQADELSRYEKELSDEERTLLRGTIRNRDITREAKDLLRQRPLDEKKFGVLLSEHQAVLRDVLRISTPKIDHMINAANTAGAYGGKINGSGGGGCMFVYAPEQPEAVAEAIEHAGGNAFIIRPDTGTTVKLIEG